MAAPENNEEILPGSHWQQTPAVDNEPNDADSTYSAFSSSASITSSILKFRKLHGRTFHHDIGDAQSWTPNDAKQSESMDLHHHLCTLLLGGKLFIAPIPKDVQSVLDIGTGNGIWAIDFADLYPKAKVIGTDVSPIQPAWTPPNLSFEIDDANQQPWAFKDKTFDFIHLRALFGSIVDWDAFYREAFRCTKPGGWIEDHANSVRFGSDDGSVKDDSPMGQWTKVFWEGSKKFGRTFRVVEDDVQKKGLEAAGFVDVKVTDIKCPIGSWPEDEKSRELGLYSRLVAETDLEGYVLYMWNAVMGWPIEEIHAYLRHLRKQLSDPSVHAWYQHRVVVARRPLEGE
ncbi:hypothetical protein OQA88_8466 [Cercophora sp. LCS_1]